MADFNSIPAAVGDIYTPFYLENSIVPTASYQDIINVSGVGYIHECILLENSAATENILITIDGKTIEYPLTATYAATGIINEESCLVDTSAILCVRNLLTICNRVELVNSCSLVTSLPFTGTKGSIYFARGSLPFNSNFRVQAKMTSGSGPILQYRIRGGLK